jgi:hypothetical protein
MPCCCKGVRVYWARSHIQNGSSSSIHIPRSKIRFKSLLRSRLVRGAVQTISGNEDGWHIHYVRFSVWSVRVQTISGNEDGWHWEVL